MRWREQTRSRFFNAVQLYLDYSSVDVQLRINEQNPMKEVGRAPLNGRATFAPDAVAFIQVVAGQKEAISTLVPYLRLETRSRKPVIGLMVLWTSR